MGTELVLETSEYFSVLTRLLAREDFIEGTQELDAMKHFLHQRHVLAVKMVNGFFNDASDTLGFIALNYGSNCQE
jgi:hypothetical protein